MENKERIDAVREVSDYDFQEELKAYQENPNNLSNWMEKLNGKKLKIPKTLIIPLSWEMTTTKGETMHVVEWLMSDEYAMDDVKAFSEIIKEMIVNAGFTEHDELFIKTGQFSNKFDFDSSCHVTNLNRVGEQFLLCFYKGMCVGCPISPEIVVREFIHTGYTRGCIYNGMKLNTEFRVFYDFTKKKLLEIFNYWDKNIMMENLDGADRAEYSKYANTIERDFEIHKDKLKCEVEQSLSSVELDGIWSVDYLWDGKQFWLIDMAIGQSSYYYDRLDSPEE